MSGGIKFLIAGIIGVIVLILLANTMFVIDETERAVVVRLGHVKTTLEPGLHIVNPFTTDVYTYDVTLQKTPVELEAYSSDGQVIDISGVVNFRINSATVDTLYKDVRTDYNTTYIIPRAQQTVKAVIAEYSAQELITHRGELPGKAKTGLVAVLENTGLIIDSIVIDDVSFDDDYERAIKNKQIEEQNALKAKNVTAQKEEEKKQTVLAAEALAEKTRLEAAALASQQGNAVIEKILAEAQLEAAKNWNGVLPTHMYGSAPLPLLNVGE
jgi:regulator of protease activity HflC (stomatin/prohibitin superfamily)